jgi:hypothetical protein
MLYQYQMVASKPGADKWLLARIWSTRITRLFKQKSKKDLL